MKSDYDTYKTWHHETQLEAVVTALEKRDFHAGYVTTVDDANQVLLDTIPADASVGVGGSVTIRELCILDKLTKRGNTVAQHWKGGSTTLTNREIRQKEGLSDYYLTSANAITRHGDIINIDGIGNRVAHMIFGPEHVIIVAGYNKIVDDIDSGITRSKEIAAVMNAQRIGSKTPCQKTGRCSDCTAPGRICRVTTIIQYRPWQTNILVLLVNAQLGF
jgi:hypothetical protein